MSLLSVRLKRFRNTNIKGWCPSHLCFQKEISLSFPNLYETLSTNQFEFPVSLFPRSWMSLHRIEFFLPIFVSSKLRIFNFKFPYLCDNNPFHTASLSFINLHLHLHNNDTLKASTCFTLNPPFFCFYIHLTNSPNKFLVGFHSHPHKNSLWILIISAITFLGV